VEYLGAMYKVDARLRSEILDYIEALHFSARGTFEVFTRLSDYKKAMFQYSESGTISYIKDNPGLSVEELIKKIEDPLDHKLPLLIKVVCLSIGILVAPIYIAMVSPIIYEMSKRHFLWGSYLDMKTINALGFLASLV
jgi:hypothetical protein